MELLLREVQDSTGVGVFVDRELSADKITIGCGNDQLIQLLGADIQAEHAVLTPAGSGVRVKTTGGFVEINGERAKSGTLAVGDTLKVGGHTLVVASAPAGFDAALELTADPDVDPAAFEHAFQTSLTDTWLSKRGPAWVLSVLVLVFGLLLPVALIIDGDDATPDPEAVFLTDAYWTSGPLHPVHNVAIGDDCGACHEVPFQKVQDTACVACHAELVDHYPDTHYAASSVTTERCAVCHVEHNEPSFLIVEADGLCVDCHADPSILSDGPGHMQAVTGFDTDNHPKFEVALLTPEATSAGTGLSFSWGIKEALLDGATETSNLKFPHDLHLDPDAVQTVQEGRGMECGDCHTLTADDEHFEPVTMEAHCQNCHELTFDRSAPNRQLPHGQPTEVIQVMQGHFALQFANPKQRKSGGRRMPDRRGGRGADCSGSAFECAQQSTEVAVLNQFTRSGCITCHVVEETESEDIYTRYQVHPIRLSHDFIPTAIFDHRSHFTQKDAQGDAACLTCHSATVSETSADLMIPGILNCNQCHSDRNTADTVPLDCINCHQYHPVMAEPINYLERHL